jgi:hypothetical protein
MLPVIEVPSRDFPTQTTKRRLHHHRAAREQTVSTLHRKWTKPQKQKLSAIRVELSNEPAHEVSFRQPLRLTAQFYCGGATSPARVNLADLVSQRNR